MTDECISPLRRRMIEDMTVRNFVAKTQTDYIRRGQELCRFSWALARYCDPGRCPPLPAASGIERNGRGNRQRHWLGAAVLLRHNARSSRDCQASAGCARAAQSAGHLEPGGSRPHVGGGTWRQVQGGAERGLWGGSAGVRSRCAEGERYRQRADDDPDRAGQAPQGPLRDAVAAAARSAARLVAGLPLAGLAVPGPRSAATDHRHASSPAPATRLRRRPGSRSMCLRTRCGTVLPPISWSRMSMFG